MQVIKRDGRTVDFDTGKISAAISKAFDSEGKTDYAAWSASNPDKANDQLGWSELPKIIAQEVANKITDDETTVEHIQDLVEKALIDHNLPNIAKHYILYRQQRSNIRSTKSVTNKVITDILTIDAKDSDDKRENANINTDSSMGAMLKVGSTVMKDYAWKNLLKPRHVKNHVDGRWHIHDADFLALCINCLYIPLRKLLDNGFSTGHGYLRSPTSINAASSLTCIAIQSSQNDFFNTGDFQ